MVMVQGQSGVFNPLDYGAKGDGVTLDTKAVRAAAAAAAAAGGGTLLFPSNYTFLTSCFNLTSNLVMEVQGAVVADARNNDWVQIPPLPWYGGGADAQMSGEPMWQGWIHSNGANNLTIRGGGLLDGNGSAWWACKHGNFNDPPCSGISRPHMFLLSWGEGVTIENVTIENSPCWTLHMAWITDLVLKNLTLNNPADAPNADGMDLDCVQNAVVEDIVASVGDDVLCVKSGIDWLGRTFGRPSANITFRSITAYAGHGITIGSEMSGGVKDVVFENINMHGTGNGPRMKSERGRGGVVENVAFRNIFLDQVGAAFDLTLNYHPGIPPTNASATPSFRNVTFSNITASKPQKGWFVDGLPESHMLDFSFVDVSITDAGKLTDVCDYAQGSCNQQGDEHCPPCLQQ